MSFFHHVHVYIHKCNGVGGDISPLLCKYINEMIYINMAAGIYQQPPILYEHMRLYCTEKEQTALYGNARMQFFLSFLGP